MTLSPLVAGADPHASGDAASAGRREALTAVECAEMFDLLAAHFDGVTAGQLGIVQWAVPRTKLSEFALEIIRRVASLPGIRLIPETGVKSRLPATGL